MSETALAFLLLYTLGLVVALFVRPIWGLYVYVGVFYLHPPSRWWGSELPDLRWSLIAAIVTLVSIGIHREARQPTAAWYESTIGKVLFLYTAWFWLQALWVPSPFHMEGAVLFTKYVLLFYVIYAVIDERSKFAGFCWSHIIGCAFLGWLAYLAPGGSRLEGVGGPGIDNSNSLGMHLSTGIMFAGFFLLAARGWSRWLVLLVIPFILNGIIQAGTRGALVGILIGGVVTVYLKPSRFRRTYWALAVLAAVGFIFLANEAFIGRMSTMTAAFDESAEWDGSAQGRVEIAKAQLRMFADYPFGVGHEGTTYLSRYYIDERWLSNAGSRASHNTLMSVLVDQGLPGILLFGILAISVARRLRALKRMDELGLSPTLGLYRSMLGGALGAAVGAGMFAQFLKAEVQIWCLALLAILWQLSRRELAVREAVTSEVEPTRDRTSPALSGIEGTVPEVARIGRQRLQARRRNP